MRPYFRERLPIFTFVIVIFILGISFGAIAVKTLDYTSRQSIFSYFNDFIKGYEEIEYSGKSLISESIKFNIINILIIWVFGISVILMPLITVLLFFKGFVLGFTVGFLVNEFGFKGIIIALVTVFPQNIIIIPVYLLATVTAVYFSLRLIKYYRGRERLRGEDLGTYTMEMAVFGIALLGGSIVETFISPFLFRVLLRFLY
jgi:stage II sporulation protein M